jgi:hypothetical protein
MIIYLLLNTDIIWKYINDDLAHKIQLLLSFINYIIFYGYINNFLRILRDLIDIDIKKNTIPKILYSFLNSLIILTIIKNFINLIYDCYKKNCINQEDNYYILFGIILEMIFVSQLLLHIFLPIHKCKFKNDDISEYDVEGYNKTIIKKFKILIGFILLIMTYNIYIPYILSVPDNLNVITSYVYSIFIMILLVKIITIVEIRTLQDLLIFVLTLLFIIVSLILDIIIFTSETNYYVLVIVNFALLLTCSIIGIYIILTNLYKKKYNKNDEPLIIN